MQKKLVAARTIAWILGVLLVIACIVIYNNYRTIEELRAPERQNLSAQQDIIREECSKTDPNGKERCAAALKNLSELLVELSKQNAAGQVPVEDASVNFQVEKKP